MCGYFCTRFIDFMLKDKSLTDFNNLFSNNDNDDDDDDDDDDDELFLWYG